MDIKTMQFSLRELAELSAKTFRTVKKRLENLQSTPGEHGAMLYELKPAIQAIFKPDEQGAPTKSMQYYRMLREKSEARLARGKANKIEFEVGRLKNQLIDVAEAQALISNMIVTFRSKILALPSKCAAQVTGLEDTEEVEEILKDTVYEALNELSQIKFGADDAGANSDSSSTQT